MSREINGRTVKGSTVNLSGFLGPQIMILCLKKVFGSLLQFNLLKNPRCTTDKIISGVNIEEFHMPKRNGLSTQVRASRTVRVGLPIRSSLNKYRQISRIKDSFQFLNGEMKNLLKNMVQNVFNQMGLDQRIVSS